MINSSLKRYPGLTNIKSGPGGIADIDFIAQSYCAHYGFVNQKIRKRETTAILSALASEKIIKRHVTLSLIELYTFLSNVEKVLRIRTGEVDQEAVTPPVPA